MKVLMSTSKQVVKMILFYSSHYLVSNEQEIAELSFFNYIFIVSLQLSYTSTTSFKKKSMRCKSESFSPRVL